MDSDERKKKLNQEGTVASGEDDDLVLKFGTGKAEVILLIIPILFIAFVIIMVMTSEAEVRMFSLKFGILFGGMLSVVMFKSYFYDASEYRITESSIVARSRLRKRSIALSDIDEAVSFDGGDRLVLLGGGRKMSIRGLRWDKYKKQVEECQDRLRAEGISWEEGGPAEIDPRNLFKWPRLHIGLGLLALVFLPMIVPLKVFGTMFAISWAFGIVLYLAYTRCPLRFLNLLGRAREFRNKVMPKFGLALPVLIILSVYGSKWNEVRAVSIPCTVLMFTLSGGLFLGLVAPTLGWEAITFLFRRRMFRRWREAIASDKAHSDPTEA